MEDTHKIARNGVVESSGHLPTVTRYSVSRAKIQPPNRYVAGENVAVLFCPAKNGLVFGVSIDRADLERVLPVGLWRVANNYPGGKRFRLYAYTFIYQAGQRKRVYLHRFVTSAPAGTEVDHGNHRGTDNRRSGNLSVVTHQENMMNQRRYAHTYAPIQKIDIAVEAVFQANSPANRGISKGSTGTPSKEMEFLENRP